MKVILKFHDLERSDKVICTNISRMYGTFFVDKLNEKRNEPSFYHYMLEKDDYIPYKSSFEE